MWKAQEWGGMCQRYKNINLNKIQRSDERVSQDKESLERHNDSLQNKRSASSLHCSREFRECHRTKSRLKGIMIVFKIKGPQVRCIAHGSFGLSQCKSSSKKRWWLIKSLERNKSILKKVSANTLHSSREVRTGSIQ